MSISWRSWNGGRPSDAEVVALAKETARAARVELEGCPKGSHAFRVVGDTLILATKGKAADAIDICEARIVRFGEEVRREAEPERETVLERARALIMENKNGKPLGPLVSGRARS